MKYIRNIGRVLYDFPGIHKKKKIVVIESDDWGSIRMPSLKIFNFNIEKEMPETESVIFYLNQ